PGGGLVTDATSTESPSTLNVGPPPRPTLFPYTTLFRSVSQGSHQVVVDLEGVDFLDSTGLGVLVGGLKRLRSHDGDMILVCTQPRILKVFEITGLTKVFAIFDTVDAALAAG